MTAVVARLFAVVLAVAAAGATNDARAQQAGDAAARQGDPSVDKTGTDPTNLQSSLNVDNEFVQIPGRPALNYTRLKYSKPLYQSLSVSVELPLTYANNVVAGNSAVSGPSGGAAVRGRVARGSQYGLGDITASMSYLAHVTRRYAVMLATDVGTPSASGELLGTGKWVLAPAVIYGIFLSRDMMFVPAYKHSVSVGGDGDREDINSGAIDFYYVVTFDQKRQFVLIDPTYFTGYHYHSYSGATVRVTYGRMLGLIGAAGISAQVRGGVGVGRDRPYGWSLDVGCKVVGF